MLDPHLSAMLWMGVVAALIIVLVMPQPLSVRALVIITILRLIFSVGLEPTLFLLGAFNVSIPPFGELLFQAQIQKVLIISPFSLLLLFFKTTQGKRNLKKIEVKMKSRRV